VIGCLITLGVLAQLQGIGRTVAATGEITGRANQAYDHIVAAQAALAQTDVAASEQEFAQAETLLAQARNQLQEALASSRHVLRFIDVTGKVRSGEELLVAGEALTQAGQSISRGITPLLTVKIVPGEAQTSPTMVDALVVAFKEFSTANEQLAQAEQALQQVSLDSLPSDIAPSVQVLQTSVPKARAALSGFLDQSQVILSVLGAERSRQYLLLFENNHEIRPTGGFIGSIGLVNVDRGVVENISVQSVYDPDGQLGELIAPPIPLLAINPRWYMRDANWFVDFATSAQKVASFFEKEGGPTVDGVIAFTPEVIKELLTVTGPIHMPTYGITVNRDNFVTLTQDQVTYAYDRTVNRPKQFLSDLIPLMLQQLFAQPADHSLQILTSLGKAITQKQLLIYFRDPAVQKRIVAAGWSGAFPQDTLGFVSVNNANIGGHKSDQFIEQEIDYRSQIEPSGDVETVVTIRRTHHGPDEKINYDYPSTEDPAFKDNVVWQRVFVPHGAQLLEARGFTSAADVPRITADEINQATTPDADVAAWQQTQHQGSDGTIQGEEAGYPYFANWQITTPGSTSIGMYRFRVANQAASLGVLNAASPYTIFVAKQAGDTRSKVRLELQLPLGYAVRHTVPNDGVTTTPPNTVIYRGGLSTDTLFGVIYTKE